MTPLIRIVSLLSAGFVLGFLVSRYLEHSIPEPPPVNSGDESSLFTLSGSGVEAPAPRTDTSKTRYQPPADAAPPLKNLQQILTISGDFGQSAALYNLAAKADVEELIDLLVQARKLGQLSERRAATSILYGRFG